MGHLGEAIGTATTRLSGGHVLERLTAPRTFTGSGNKNSVAHCLTPNLKAVSLQACGMSALPCVRALAVSIVV